MPKQSIDIKDTFLKYINISSLKFGKDIFVYGFLTVFSKGAQFALLPILTSVFSPSDFGVIESITILIGLLSLVSTLSLESAVARLWLEVETPHRKAQLFSTIFFTVTCFSIIFFLALILTSENAFLKLSNIKIQSVLPLAVAAGLLTSLTSIPQMVMRIERNIFNYGAVQIINGVLSIFISILLVVHFQMGLKGLYLGYLTASLTALIVALISTRKYLTARISLPKLKESIKYSLPLLPGVILIWLSGQIDKYVLVNSVGFNSLGLYAAAAKVAMIFSFLVEVFRLAWFPLALKTIGTQKQSQFIRTSLSSYFAVMLLLGCVVTAYCKEILFLFTNEQYLQGYIVIPLLIFSQVLLGSTNITNIGMLISKKTGAVSFAAATGVLVNVVVTYLFVTAFGISGAAVGSMLSAFIITAMLCSFSIRKGNIDFDLRFVVLLLITYFLFSCSILLAYTLDGQFSVFIRSILLILSLLFLMQVSRKSIDINLLASK